MKAAVRQRHAWLLLIGLGILLTSCSRETSRAGYSPAADVSAESGTSVREIALTSPSSMWVLTESGRVMRTVDGAENWADVTPVGFDPVQPALGALDGNSACLFTPDPTRVSALLKCTHDGGATWSSATAAATIIRGRGLGGGSFFLLDANHVWLDVDVGSNANFSRGQVLRSTDGGRTWIPGGLTLFGRPHFLDAVRGWVAAQDKVDVTVDAASTWTEEAIPTAPGWSADDVTTGSELMAGRAAPILVVRHADRDRGGADAIGFFQASSPTGAWRYLGRITNPHPEVGFYTPTYALDPSSWFTTVGSDSAGHRSLRSTTNRGATWADSPTYGSYPIAHVEFASTTVGVILVTRPYCAKPKAACTSWTGAYLTRDVGRSWRQVNPP